MKTSTALLLIGGVAVVGGTISYRNGVNDLVFGIDGFQAAPDGVNLMIRLKVTNPNKFWGYPVPVLNVNAFDENNNYLGTIINTQLQYIPANTVSYIYGIINANLGNLLVSIVSSILNGKLPNNLKFQGYIQVAGVQLPISTFAKIGIGGKTNSVIKDIQATFEEEYGGTLSEAIDEIKYNMESDEYNNDIITPTVRLFYTDNYNFENGSGIGFYFTIRARPGTTSTFKITAV